MQETESGYSPIFIARQPVFDGRMNLWGHELLFRDSEEARHARIDDPDRATASVIADGFALAQEAMLPGQYMLVNMPQGLLEEEYVTALPAEICIPEILETVHPTPEVLERLQLLKARGYTLALDDFVGQPGNEALLELADIIKVDVLAVPPDDLPALVASLHRRGAQLLAEKVEDNAMFHRCLDLGFTLFQGFFFARPEVVPGRKPSVAQSTLVRLLPQLSGPAEPRKLGRTIGTDPGLSYRLLRHINSAWYGLTRTVSSVEHAVLLLGERPTRTWLLAVLLSDAAKGAKGHELTFVAVRRARFLELAQSEAPAATRRQPDAMFLMGLFSGLDALLGMSMSEVVERLTLDDDIASALCGTCEIRSDDCIPARWLHLATALEKADWTMADSILASLGLSQGQAARFHAQSLLWAARVLRNDENP